LNEGAVCTPSLQRDGEEEPMPVRWMDHKGKRILYADYRGLKPEQIDSLARETDAKLAASPLKVLFLSNIEGAIVTTETMLNVKRSAGSVLRDKVEKIAVVGVTGCQEGILRRVCHGSGEDQRPILQDREGGAGLAGRMRMLPPVFGGISRCPPSGRDCGE
jgi:hypothetical protein